MFSRTWKVVIVKVNSFPNVFVSETTHAASFFFKTFPKQALVFTCLQYMPFENTVGKGEIARHEQFLLFPQCFLYFQRALRYFHQNQNCRLQTLSVWKSLKFVVWERVNPLLHKRSHSNLDCENLRAHVVNSKITLFFFEQKRNYSISTRNTVYKMVPTRRKYLHIFVYGLYQTTNLL